MFIDFFPSKSDTQDVRISILFHILQCHSHLLFKCTVSHLTFDFTICWIFCWTCWMILFLMLKEPVLLKIASTSLLYCADKELAVSLLLFRFVHVMAIFRKRNVSSLGHLPWEIFSFCFSWLEYPVWLNVGKFLSVNHFILWNSSK